MTKKTADRIIRATNVAYHRLALGIYGRTIASRGKSVTEEIGEYLRECSKLDMFGDGRTWRNILKTKEQKELAVSRMANLHINEFGSSTQPFLPGFGY